MLLYIYIYICIYIYKPRATPSLLQATPPAPPAAPPQPGSSVSHATLWRVHARASAGLRTCVRGACTETSMPGSRKDFAIRSKHLRRPEMRCM